MNNLIEALDESLDSFEKNLESQPEPELINSSQMPDVFKDNIVERMAREWNRVSGISLVLCQLVARGIVSIAAGRKYQLVGAYTLPSYANIYIMGVARSGAGKSVTLNTLKEPLSALQSKLDKKQSEDQIANAEELYTLTEDRKEDRRELRNLRKIKKKERENENTNKEKKKKKKKEKEKDNSTTEEPNTNQNITQTLHQKTKTIGDLINDIEVNSRKIYELENPKYPSIYKGDITPECLGERLNETDGCLSIMSGEAPKILDVFLGLYSGGQPQLSLLNEGKCNGEWQIDRKSTREHREQVYIEEVTMSLLLLSQPDKAAEFFINKRVDDQGTIGRFIVVDPKAKKQRRGGVKRKFDETIREDYFTFIKNLATRSEEQTPIEVRCGGEAKTIFDNYYNENLDLSEEAEKSGQNGEAQIYSRAAEIAINLALLLYIEDSEDSGVLEASTAERAVELHQYFRRCSIQFLREAKNFSKTSLFQRISNTITRKRSLTRSKLLKLNNYKAADLDAFEKAISKGEVKGVTIEKDDEDTKKPTTTYTATL